MSSEILAASKHGEGEGDQSRRHDLDDRGSYQGGRRTGVNEAGEIRVEISPKTGTMKAWSQLKVVESVSDTATEIHADKARLYADSPGWVISWSGRSTRLPADAAKTAEQAIKQQLRQFEKEHIYDEFKDQVGTSLRYCTLQGPGDLIVAGKAEALLLGGSCSR